MRQFLHEMTKYSHQLTFFNDVYATCLRMRMILLCARMTKYTPESTFFIDVHTTYYLYA